MSLARSRVSRSPLLDRIQRAALEYGAALPPFGPAFIADRLYRFHALPHAGPVPVPSAELLALARKGWELQSDPSGTWTSFFRESRATGRFKLYFSPHPSDLILVARRAFPVLLAAGARAIKFGAQPATLLRPDRCVAYFGSADELHAAGRELSHRLKDIAALGVPFTGPVDRRGLLSWGCDPSVGGSSTQSWRQYVTECLGKAVHRAGRSGRPLMQVVRRALQSAGVDPASFAPLPVFLQRHRNGKTVR